MIAIFIGISCQLMCCCSKYDQKLNVFFALTNIYQLKYRDTVLLTEMSENYTLVLLNKILFQM